MNQFIQKFLSALQKCLYKIKPLSPLCGVSRDEVEGECRLTGDNGSRNSWRTGSKGPCARALGPERQAHHWHGNAKKLFLITMTNLVFSSVTFAQNVTAHIFIHGTRFSGLAFASALPFLNGDLRGNNLYTIAVRKSRDDRRLFDSQVMLARGMVEISRSCIEQCRRGALPPEISKQAAVHVANGYDTLCASTGTPTNAINLYYAFGWDGLLEDNHRREAAGELYNALIHLKEHLVQQYKNCMIRLILHGHSHGGNVILYVAYHENNQKKNLMLDTVCLYGTPIQVETANYAQHAMFKKIICFYSDADSIQVSDKVSTESGTSQRRLSTFTTITNTPDKKIIDVGLRMNGNTHIFNHASYFFIDMYHLATTPTFPLQVLGPLPVVTYAPVIMQLLDRMLTRSISCTHAFIDFIVENENTLSIIAIDEHGNYLQRSKNLAPLMWPIKATLENTWRPYACYGTANIGKLAFSGLIGAIPEYVRRNL